MKHQDYGMCVGEVTEVYADGGRSISSSMFDQGDVDEGSSGDDIVGQKY